MKTTPPVLVSILATALLATAPVNLLHAQSWQTVNDFQAIAGLPAAGSDIGFDSQGNVYAVGGASLDVGDVHRQAIVNVTADQGESWSTMPPFQGPVRDWEHNRAFASAGNHLFLGGNGNVSGSWFVRESVDGGATWSQTDAIPSDSVGCSAIAINPLTGDVYAAGSSASVGALIRKRAATSSAFIPVYSNGPGDIGIFWSLAFHPNGTVFAAGNRIDGATRTSSWLLLRSTSGEPGTWEVNDTFRTRDWTGFSAGGCLVTPSGDIYVSGWAYNAKARKTQWVVRTSSNAGATWSLSDSFTLGGPSAQVFEIVQDSAGNLYVCGQAADRYGKLFWVVRKGEWVTTLVKGKPVTSFTWTTSDAFQLAPGRTALPLGITVEPISGNVMVCGRAEDANGIAHFIVRRLRPQ